MENRIRKSNITQEYNIKKDFQTTKTEKAYYSQTLTENN